MSPSTEVRENRAFASEIKFLVTPALAAQLRPWAKAHLGVDPYVSEEFGDAYRTTSIYFDTAGLDVYHRRGSFGRSKYRIRRYGAAEAVFLERKLKTHDLVSKRRSIICVGDLAWLAGPEARTEWAGYWFHRRLLARKLAPVCQISYLRNAYVARTDYGPIRLTLDQEIRALPLDRLAFRAAGNSTLLSQAEFILELKYVHQTPALFKSMVEQFQLRPAPVSKYRLAAVALGLAPERRKNSPTERVPNLLYA